MSDQGQQALEQALSLAPEERVKVVELLLSSLDSESQQRIDSLWATEAEDRLDALDRGEIRTIPARAVFNEVSKPKS
jgi:putative addiction module component (TIGR02574 family)